jgi:hypothetical protein
MTKSYSSKTAQESKRNIRQSTMTMKIMMMNGTKSRTMNLPIQLFSPRMNLKALRPKKRKRVNLQNTPLLLLKKTNSLKKSRENSLNPLKSSSSQ